MPAFIKICGLNSADAVRMAVKAGANYAGFVYYPKSPRHLSVKQASDLRLLVPENISAVSVLVNPENDLLRQIAAEINPDFFQLHGEETPERLREIRSKFPDIGIIKSIPIRSAEDLLQTDKYIKLVDYLLFDAKPTNSNMMHGGNGLAFDWAILSGKKFNIPWFLSGGLNSENVAQAIKISGAKMVDVSSGVERSAGVKDERLINEFVKAVRG